MHIRTLVVAFLVSLAAAPAAYAQPAGMPAGGMPGMTSGPTEVGVVTLQPETAPITSVLRGRVIASATAEVRPQVSGIVTSVTVEEGQAVEKGDLIASIDSSSYEAEVAVAEASLTSAEAQVPVAQSKVDRYQTLVESGSVSQSELDVALVELAQAKASVASAEAQLTSAKLTVEKASITAPISGVIGAVNVQVGSLLTANQTDAITTVRQIDPVEIALVESSANLLAARASLAGPTPTAEDTSEPPSAVVTLTLEDGSSYDQEGSITTMNLIVDESTGTFTLHASIPNPDLVLLPGMFVRATIAFGEQENVFLVPQRAVTFNNDGQPTAYFVGADNKVEQRVLVADREIDNAWVVTSGVEAGDQLIVDGLQKIQAGAEVSPLEVTIDEDGVIHQEAPVMPEMSGEMPAGTTSGAAPPAGASDSTPASTDGEVPATAPAGTQGSETTQPPAEGASQ